MMKLDKDSPKYVIGNVIPNPPMFATLYIISYHIIGIHIYIMMLYFILVEMLEFRLVQHIVMRYFNLKFHIST